MKAEHKRHQGYLEIDGYRAHLLLVDPLVSEPPDVDHPSEPDWSMWLMFVAMGDRQMVPLSTVFRRCLEWSNTSPLFHIMWSLWHPQTPFGLMYRPRVPRAEWHEAMRDLVIFRGEWHLRDCRGVLTATGQPVPYHPSPELFEEALYVALTEQRKREGS